MRKGKKPSSLYRNTVRKSVYLTSIGYIFILSILNCSMATEELDELKGYEPESIISYPDTDAIISLTFQDSDFVWAATLGGAVRWNIKSGTYEKVILDSDWDAKFWEEYLTHARSEEEVIKKAMTNTVIKVYALEKGEIWVRTRIGLVICSDTTVLRRYETDKSAIEKEYNNLISQKERVEIWPIGPLQYVWLHHPGLKTVRKFKGRSWQTLDFNEIAAADSKAIEKKIEINHIFEDINGTLWFGTASGIFKYDGIEWRIFSPKQILKTETDFVGSPIYQTKRGEIWFWNPDGMITFDGTDWTLFRGKCKGDYACPSILETKSGELWFPSNMGAWRFTAGKWVKFSTKDGLPSNYVQQVFEDSAQNLWFSTDKGVANYDGKRWKIFTKKDGLVDERFPLIYQDPKGNMWFATGSGLSMYDGKEWKTFKTKRKE